MDFVSAAAIVGFFGDASLQVIVSNTDFNWGLRKYFSEHGRAESMFLAAGMLAIFYIFYIYVTRLPVTILTMAIYGVLLDLLFRVTMIFPSLRGYYDHLNYFWSAVWGAIPMMLPVMLVYLIKLTKK
jgi:hypothetical protein